MKNTLPRCNGVIHLPPLPGSPGASGMDPSEALQKAGAIAVREALILKKEGFDGIILENFGDAPFYPTKVPVETVVAFSVIAAAVRESVSLPLGINVLRNDALTALSLAAVTGADFIRVNVLSGVMATDQGIIEGRAFELLRERQRLNADHISILADVHVKHAKSLSSDSLSLAIEETAGRGGADAVIVTGSTTGRPPSQDEIKEAVRASLKCSVPLYVGSGLDPESLKNLPDRNIGMIVGSTLRRGGKAGAPLDLKRIRSFIAAQKKWKKSGNGKSRKSST
ncbi:MAG: BtpA/SgcQ family protein [Bdellovibrionales bacterium]|nr:BtpA/SgcQ family protein [Bdellovibrionales bacterium]